MMENPYVFGAAGLVIEERAVHIALYTKRRYAAKPDSPVTPDVYSVLVTCLAMLVATPNCTRPYVFQQTSRNLEKFSTVSL
jgi:hypothetical protein